MRESDSKSNIIIKLIEIVKRVDQFTRIFFRDNNYEKSFFETKIFSRIYNFLYRIRETFDDIKN